MTSVEQSTDPFLATAPGQRERIYAELRCTGGPVQRATAPGGLDVWLVTGHDEARAAMADPRLVKVMSHIGRRGMQLIPEAYENLRHHLLLKDGAEHARMRRLVGAAFTRRQIDALAPRVQAVTDELLDALDARGAGEVDLVGAFAYPLPMTVICELLGVPPALGARFRESIAPSLGGLFSSEEAFVSSTLAMVEVLKELVALKRREPAGDLLSALVAVRDQDGDRLSEPELTSLIFLLVSAGHETTVNLICNSVYALATHPEQLAALRADPDLLPDAVEELLRYDGPVQTTFVMEATERLTLGPVVIEPGDLVVPALTAANRDTTRTPDADALDVTREYAPHLAFGHGIHHCLGAPLARLETRIALGSLIARFPGLRLARPAEDYRKRPSQLFNAFQEMPVVLR